MNSLDVNHDNLIDYNEFVTAAFNRMNLLNKNNLIIAFNILDVNNDGKLSLEEIRSGFAGYMVVASDKAWKDMIMEVDKNNDGYISYQEFEDYMLEVLKLTYFGNGVKVDVPDNSTYSGEESLVL